MDKAIGLVHINRTDEILRDHSWIEKAARECGYTLTRILSVDNDTYMPTTYILAQATKERATVIITPDLYHLGTGYKAVPQVCSILLPTGLVHRAPKAAF